MIYFFIYFFIYSKYFKRYFPLPSSPTTHTPRRVRSGADFKLSLDRGCRTSIWLENYSHEPKHMTSWMFTCFRTEHSLRVPGDQVWWQSDLELSENNQRWLITVITGQLRLLTSFWQSAPIRGQVICFQPVRGRYCKVTWPVLANQRPVLPGRTEILSRKWQGSEGRRSPARGNSWPGEAASGAEWRVCEPQRVGRVYHLITHFLKN